MIEFVTDNLRKRNIAEDISINTNILNTHKEAIDDFIHNNCKECFFNAIEDNKNVGFLHMSHCDRDSMEIDIVAVKKDYQKQGIGKRLVEAAKECARKTGHNTLEIKALADNEGAENIEKFLFCLGFKESRVFPILLDEWRLCQVYSISL